MKKIKLLTLAAFAMMATGAWAQTEVTSTYLTNADFSLGTLASPAICTYAKDKSSNNTEYANLVQLDGWTAVDNGDGKAGGPVAIGSGVWIGGEGYSAPATNSDGDVEGNVLGIVGCWSASAQYTQNLQSALPAGAYTIVLCVYNSKGGTTGVDKNLIGFVEEGGTEHFASTKQYPVNTWKYEFITFTLAAETSGYVSLGYKSTNTGSGNMPHLFISGLELYSGTLDQEAYEAAKTAAREAKEAKVYWDLAVNTATETLADEAYAAVIGVEKAAVEAELAKAEPTDKDGYNAATEALNNATNAFTAAKASYEAVPEANALAEEYGLTKVVVTAESSAAAIDAAVAEIKESVFTFVEANYPYEISLGAWTTTGSVKEEKGQHWNGNSASTYNEPNYWGNSAGGNASWTQDVTLPAGNYVLKIAGRHSTNSTFIVTIKQGEDVLSSADDFPAKGSGKGIDLDGKANFSDEGSYANNGAGWGFEWRMLKFTLSEETAVTIAIDYESATGSQYASFCNYVIKAQTEKALLKVALDMANAIDITANVGDGVFQKSSEAAASLTNNIELAQEVYDDSSSSSEDVEHQIDLLNNAIDYYNKVELNAPTNGQLFNIIQASEGWTYKGLAATFLANDRSDAGLYNIKYKEAPNKNLAQAFTLTKVEGNNYLLSQIDTEGVVRYVSTGTVYGGNDFQLRTTTNVAEAAKFTVIATNTDGIYNLYNVAANQYVGSQDAGFFTVNSHIEFQIVETTKPSIAINTTAAGWGTVMLPFAVASLPEGVKAYTVSSLKADEKELNLSEVTALEANKPYIIEGTWNETLTGDAQGTALTYTEGWLTGVYAETLAPAASYVLQNNNDLVAFYRVEADNEPTVGANRAYLTVPGSEGVKAFFFPGLTTAIQGVFSEVANGNIHDLQGRKVRNMQKGGVYVINGQKVTVK